MKLDIPPTQGLIAFEALARHLNFSRTAEELNVTASAVSHQIKKLEMSLGIQLFDRSKRTVVLTPSGSRYVDEVRGSLQRLALATKELRGVRGQSLAINMLPSFASRWLMQRLADFIDRHSNVDLRIAATQEGVTPHEGGPHLCIRYGHGTVHGVQARRLGGEGRYAGRGPRAVSGAVLRGELPDSLPLLRDSHEPWHHWFKATGQESLLRRIGPRYDDSGLLLQAAEAGQGVALARGLLARDAVTTGVLARIGTLEIQSQNSYFLVQALNTNLSPSAALFADWLHEEMQQTQDDTAHIA